MKLKLEQIYDAVPPLSRMAQKPFAVSMAWRIQRNLKLIEPEGKQVEKLLLELARDKYDAEEKSPGFYQVVDKEQAKEFEEEKNLLALGLINIPINGITLANNFNN